MEFRTFPAPHLPPRTSVSAVMAQVLAALLPAALAHVWFFGPGLLLNATLAIATAVGSEALMLRMRKRPIKPALGDLSAIVAAVLLAFALPPLTPWWVTCTGAAFAIIFAKHLYGGLGFNPFNPAMAGYAVLLLSFPVEMSTWPAPAGALGEAGGPGLGATIMFMFSGQLPGDLAIDAFTLATPLDRMQAEIGRMQMMSEVLGEPVFGSLGGRGWEWVSAAAAAGGVFLLARGIIRWQIPLSVLMSLALCATLFYLLDSDRHAAPLFHLFSGATMLCAFFIATDPVSAATTAKGRLLYGAGIGVLIYLIRGWGKFPDGVAFAVLLMNAAVPAIDHFTRPRTYGYED